MTRPNFDGAAQATAPFAHIRIPAILSPDVADSALRWLREEAPWVLRVESFYEQHEFSLCERDLGRAVANLASDAFIEHVKRGMIEGFGLRCGLELVDVSAHRLTAGQTIKIHNDFIGEEESHRLLIQLNDGWSADRGGMLMLFGGEQPESLAQIVMPRHASGFAFEISPTSFHAVSSIRSGERYTLVYTFRRSPSASQPTCKA